ncbi:hypothetical protein B0A58_08435 [Flavobacterium branchiophilum NBRC 15030 = ATCC 35035]|uniref:SGNH/GDSL hydrolase family protein n=1 Tax=Flavobacterium branchiophilum TaxID=55197 RepID=A0A543G428_9FLAO|nr:hypothetical protein [Flavobacterium branchiophilum]OXA75815.1 hypothetical protein B0A58_08435 [Flavobacterium branchiophilum NBRC 15030 = ATCC 35035]TQM40838.1 hypothetical protein BC670_1752 [Flavobacterium branchiophilum]GEM54868.1 hypothetical protein FB1_10890 [Flavobacterium branchiophilum NBRC 15030 = ATCC 35035]
MKIFIKKTFFFILPIIIAFVTIEILIRNIPNDYQVKKSYLDLHAGQIKTLILGSSHTFYGLDPRYIASNCYNASYISQPLNYDLEILEKYDTRFEQLQTIIVPIDYFSLYFTLNGGASDWRIKNYVIYYGFEPQNEVSKHFEILNVKFKDNIKRIWSFYFKNKSAITTEKLGWGNEYQSKYKKNLVATGKTAAKRHGSKSKKHFKNNVKIVNDIIEYARKKHCKLILVTSPAYKTYTDQLHIEQLEQIETQIQKFVKLNRHVCYYNFLKDSSFIATDFYDADHLNEKGALKWSKKIQLLLKKN